MMVENENQISIVFTEPQALMFSDAMNLIAAIMSADSNFIGLCTDQIITSYRKRLYTKETAVEMLAKVDVIAKHYMEKRKG